MEPDDARREQFRRLGGFVALVAMVGGFTLSFAGTTRYDWTLLTWLGYPEYNTSAFLVGVAGFLALVVYGYLVSGERD